MHKNKVPLKISIAKPCNQNWDEMAESNGGRYCNACTQVVYDFSQMSDNELFHYFESAKTKVCGRFHPHQLDVAIHPLKKKHISASGTFQKIAAAVATFISLETATAQSAEPISKNDSLVRVHEKGLQPTEKIVLSGIVTKGMGGPLKNVKVGLDTIATTYTKADGSFSFELKEDQITTHNLYFSFEGLERTVRTYHPAMGSTGFNVSLSEPRDYSMEYVKGGITSFYETFPEVIFKNNSSTIVEDIKIALEITAGKLKNEPSMHITLEGYGTLKKHRALINKQFTEMKKFLLSMGIDGTRIKTSITPISYVNVIDITQTD